MPSVELRKLSGVTGLGVECVSTLHAQVCTQSSPKLRRLARPSRSSTGLYIEPPKTKGAYTLASRNPCGSGARAAVGLRLHQNSLNHMVWGEKEVFCKPSLFKYWKLDGFANHMV
jgi:hypothetical protein